MKYLALACCLLLHTSLWYVTSTHSTLISSFHIYDSLHFVSLWLQVQWTLWWRENLNWRHHHCGLIPLLECPGPITSVIKKAQPRIYPLRPLKKFNLPAKTIVQFYTVIIQSILTYCITVWYTGATTCVKHRLQCIELSDEKVIGCSLPSLQELYISRLALTWSPWW